VNVSAKIFSNVIMEGETHGMCARSPPFRVVMDWHFKR